jgi:transposase
MSKQLKNVSKSQIIALLELGFSTREVAEKFNINQSTVVRIRQKYIIFNTFEHLCGNGRPTVISDQIKAVIKRENLKNPRNSLRKFKEKIREETGENIGKTSVKKALNSMGLFAFSPIKKPCLTRKHIDRRYQISMSWINMGIEKIKTIIFSDESKFNLFYSDNKPSVWREPRAGLKSEHINHTVKYGGKSVVAWGCFSYYGVGRLVFIDGNMDAPHYVCILADNLFASASEMGLNEFIFQQDNDPKHTSRLAMNFFRERNIDLLPWPSQSPDMNPIENLWGIIKEKVSKLRPRNIYELKAAILQEWNGISRNLTEKLVLSFQKRAIKLYRAKGATTKY